MKTRKWLTVTLLLVIVLLTTVSSVAADDLTAVGQTQDEPIARQVSQTRPATYRRHGRPVTLIDSEMKILKSKITGRSIGSTSVYL